MITRIGMGTLALAAVLGAGSAAWAQDKDRDWRRELGRQDPFARLEQALSRIEAALHRLEAALGGRGVRVEKVEAARGPRTGKAEDRVIRLRGLPFEKEGFAPSRMWVQKLPGSDQRFEFKLDREFDFGFSRPAPAPRDRFEPEDREDEEREYRKDTGRCPHCGRSDRGK